MVCTLLEDTKVRIQRDFISFLNLSFYNSFRLTSAEDIKILKKGLENVSRAVVNSHWVETTYKGFRSWSIFSQKYIKLSHYFTKYSFFIVVEQILIYWLSTISVLTFWPPSLHVTGRSIVGQSMFRCNGTRDFSLLLTVN